MKTKKQNLDVDFIGGQGALTKFEEEELNAYFRKQKKGSKRTTITPNNKKRNKATA